MYAKFVSQSQTMETAPLILDRTSVKSEFIAELESQIKKPFLFDWAMGWMLDVSIDEAIANKVPEHQLFKTIFRNWREKCLELSEVVLRVDDDTHLYAGVDLTKISPEVCQRWRNRFAHLSIDMDIS